MTALSASPIDVNQALHLVFDRVQLGEGRVHQRYRCTVRHVASGEVWVEVPRDPKGLAVPFALGERFEFDFLRDGTLHYLPASMKGYAMKGSEHLLVARLDGAPARRPTRSAVPSKIAPSTPTSTAGRSVNPPTSISAPPSRSAAVRASEASGRERRVDARAPLAYTVRLYQRGRIVTGTLRNISRGGILVQLLAGERVAINELVSFTLRGVRPDAPVDSPEHTIHGWARVLRSDGPGLYGCCFTEIGEADRQFIVEYCAKRCAELRRFPYTDMFAPVDGTLDAARRGGGS